MSLIQIVTVSIVAMAVWSVEALLSAENSKQIVMGMVKECAKEAKATDADMESFKRKELPTTKEGKCTVACMYKKFGIIQDDKYSMEGLISSTKMIISEDDKKMEIIKDVAKKCEPEAVGEDACEIASNLMACNMKYVKEHGIELPM